MLAALIASASLHNCSTERDPVTLPGAHPDSWMDAESPDFHGRFVSLDGTAACEHCHGIEASGGSSGVSCADCHGAGTDACVECHGGLDNMTGAPPYGLDGETSDTSLAVGAHTVHLEASSLGAPAACGACHIVPTFVFSPNHLDPGRPSGQPLDYIAEITWSGIADGGGAAWSRSARTCSGTYCHGNFTGGNAANKPVWAGANQAGCGSCHDVGGDPAKLTGRHDKHVREEGFDCIECHASVVSRTMQIVDLGLHADGVKTVSILKGGTFLSGSCSGLNNTSCHGAESWYED
ncbi:MAG: CxxxxCH/CxxCH domain-containing protein [Chitinivibrionia bacterium]|nr:CxxxxCH/CxxCH domain-containing protein [Chitinivibrionia bacterium]